MNGNKIFAPANSKIIMRFIRDRFKRAGTAKDIIGLDIGSSTIKCVVLAGSACSYQLKYYCAELISPELTGNKQASEQVVASIKRLLASADILSRRCVIALPDSVVTSHWIRMDSAVADDIETAISLSIEEHIPYPLDEIYFDYQVFDGSAEGQNYVNVLLVACRKKHVDIRLEIMQQTDLIPLSIEVSSYAMQWAYAQLYPTELTNTSLLFDIGINHLTLLFLGEAKQMRSHSESMVNIVDKEIILQRVQQCFSTFYLAYPYYTFNKIFFIGSNYSLLEFLVKKMIDIYGLKVEILSLNKGLNYADDVNKEKFISLFSALYLSFSLALRGLRLSE
jgi:Tfp pilus assembly PilM family ATPase